LRGEGEGPRRSGRGVGNVAAENQLELAIYAMLKKLRHPVVRGTLLGCFIAGLGFAVWDAGIVNAVYQVLEEPDYFGPGVIFFTLFFTLAGTLQDDFFFWRFRLIRRRMRSAQKAADAARELDNEKRVLLAKLNEYGLEPELLLSITDAPNKA
jgi:hypothetical protein